LKDRGKQTQYSTYTRHQEENKNRRTTKEAPVQGFEPKSYIPVCSVLRRYKNTPQREEKRESKNTSNLCSEGLVSCYLEREKKTVDFQDAINMHVKEKQQETGKEKKGEMHFRLSRNLAS
jgi:hypothetical protein